MSWLSDILLIRDENKFLFFGGLNRIQFGTKRSGKSILNWVGFWIPIARKETTRKQQITCDDSVEKDKKQNERFALEENRNRTKRKMKRRNSIRFSLFRVECLSLARLSKWKHAILPMQLHVRRTMAAAAVHCRRFVCQLCVHIMSVLLVVLHHNKSTVCIYRKPILRFEKSSWIDSTLGRFYWSARTCEKLWIILFPSTHAMIVARNAKTRSAGEQIQTNRRQRKRMWTSEKKV